jgi:DNA invertase Pin-like site-specific DNA recombinase
MDGHRPSSAMPGRFARFNKAGVSKSEIARRLSISRTLVRRFLEP